MPAVHFTKSPAPKHTIYFQCQIHASKCQYVYNIIIVDPLLLAGEWISGAVCMYIANYLCENGNDAQVDHKIT